MLKRLCHIFFERKILHLISTIRIVAFYPSRLIRHYYRSNLKSSRINTRQTSLFPMRRMQMAKYAARRRRLNNRIFMRKSVKLFDRSRITSPPPNRINCRPFLLSSRFPPNLFRTHYPFSPRLV